jgi:hypothetical protein
MYESIWIALLTIVLADIICNSRAFQDKLMVEKFSKSDKNFIKRLGHFRKIV